MSKQINTLLVGFGFSGSTFHGPFLKALPQFNLTTVVSKQTDKVRNQLPDVVVVDDLDEALQNDEINLVVITTPVHCHFKHVKQALEAGKDVVVEKPFTVSSREAEELIKIAQLENRILTVFHNRRWDGDFMTVQDILNQNLLGDVYHYEVHFHRYRPTVNTARWKESDSAGSGILYDLGSHLIDQALLLFGSPNEITTDIVAQRPSALAIDYFHLTFKHDNRRVILGSF